MAGRSNLYVGGTTTVTAIQNSDVLSPPTLTVKVPRRPLVFYLLGPTGAGKSTFVECLSRKQGLGISSFGLEGYTQSVTAYRLQNMAAGTPRRSIVLVDTPGLEDPNISELSVILQIRQWAEKHDLSDNVYLLYFFPINATRLPGSKSYCLEIFKALSSSSATDHSFIITSMWNLVEGTPRLKDRAESNFKQLGNKSWLKSRIFGGPTMPTMLRFHATKKSTIDVLELCCKNKAGSIASISRSVGFTDTALGRLLYGSIITRLQDLRQRWTITKQERLTSQDQYEVIQELDKEDKRIAANFKKFEADIKAGGFDRPPTPPPPHTPPPASPILDVPPQSNNDTTESLTRGDIDLEPQHTQRTIEPQDTHRSPTYASQQS